MTTRDRIVVGVLACVVAIAGFWFLALKPKRAEADAASARAADAQTQLNAANEALSTATAARASFDQDYAVIAKLGKAVPEDDDAASLVFQIETAARKAGIDFRSLTVGGGSAAPAATTTTTTTPADTAKSGDSANAPGSASGSTTGTTGATGTTGVPATGTLPPGVVAGTGGMNRLPFTFIFDGDYFAMTKLLDLLRSFTTAKGDTVSVRGRLMTVEGVTLEQSREKFPKVKATISATAYLSSEPITLPGGSTAPAPAAPAAPEGTQTPSSTQAAGGSSSLPAATVTPGVVR
jgi:hypothetical protein